MAEDLYAEAVREWIARQLRRRGHKEYTRDKIRNVRFGIAEGWPGTEVTPGDEDYTAIHCELKQYDRKVGDWSDEQGWVQHDETIEFITPVEFVQQCLAIYEELRQEAEEK